MVTIKISVRDRVRVKVRLLRQEVLEKEFGNWSSVLSYLVKFNLRNFNVIADNA